MSAEDLKTAQQLIKQGRYGEARAILSRMDSPMAKAWLESLQGLNDSDSSGGRLKWIVIAVAVIALIIGVIYVTYVHQQNMLGLEVQNAMRFVSPREELQAECDRRGYTAEECQEWILKQVLPTQQPQVVPPGGKVALPPAR